MKVLLVGVVVVAACGGKKESGNEAPKNVTVDPVGVVVTVPASWELTDRGQGLYSVSGSYRHVSLQKADFSIEKIEDARRAANPEYYKVTVEKPLAAGGWYFELEGLKDAAGSKKVEAYLSLGATSVQCTAPLLPDRDKPGDEDVRAACASLRKK